MSFARPTLAQLIARVVQDLGPAASLRRSFERFAAHAIAAVSHSLHGHLDWNARQATPATATAEDIITAWATAFGLVRKQPTQGTGTATFAGTNGTVIPAGWAITLANGADYTADADATVALGTVTVAITSVEYAASVNADAGAAAQLGSPISGISSTGTLDEDIDDGSDLETIESLQERLLERMKTPPRGGAPADYVAWAKATPGVKVGLVHVLKNHLGDGTMAIVFTISDPADPTASPIPSEPQRAAVEAYVAPLVPAVIREFRALVPTAQDVTYEIQIAPNTDVVKDAVKSALRDLHRREAVPGGALLRSHVSEAISSATGETDHVLLAPVTDVVASSSTHLLTFNPSLVTFSAIP